MFMLLPLFCLITTAYAQVSVSNDTVQSEMVWVEGGSFEMGSNAGEKNEQPTHTVLLNDYYIGKHEVTQALWRKVMGDNPSYFKDCEECPVEEVSPERVEDFLNKLNQRTGKRYCLPTEAEWEYAALGGNKSKGYRYSGSDSLFEVGWIKDIAEERTHPVGRKQPNELGLYDMSGNVWELCRDWWDAGYYKQSPNANPVNDKKALFKVVRGGSWRSEEDRCYSKARNRNVYDHHKQNCGFRLVLDK